MAATMRPTGIPTHSRKQIWGYSLSGVGRKSTELLPEGANALAPAEIPYAKYFSPAEFARELHKSYARTRHAALPQLTPLHLFQTDSLKLPMLRL